MSPSARVLVTRIATVVALVALPLGMLSVWVTAYVSSTDRYVATVRPLAHDPAVQGAAETFLVDRTMSAIDSSDTFGATLQGLGGSLSCLGVDTQALGGIATFIGGFLSGDSPLSAAIMSQLRPFIEQAVRNAVVQSVESPLFEKVWVQANRTAHREVLAVLEDKASPRGGADKILIPLTDIASSFANAFGCKNLIPASVAGAAPAFTLVNASDLQGARTGYRVLHPLGYGLPVLFLLALALALAAATSRRRTGVVLALGALVGAGFVELVLVITKHVITSDDADHAIVDAIWGALTHRLDIALIVLAVGSTLVAAGLWFWDRSVRTPGPGVVPGVSPGSESQPPDPEWTRLR